MYTNWLLNFSRVKRHQPHWQFPEKHYALWEIRERRIPQPDWDFHARPIIREMHNSILPQPCSLPKLQIYEVLPPKR